MVQLSKFMIPCRSPTLTQSTVLLHHRKCPVLHRTPSASTDLVHKGTEKPQRPGRPSRRIFPAQVPPPTSVLLDDLMDMQKRWKKKCDKVVSGTDPASSLWDETVQQQPSSTFGLSNPVLCIFVSCTRRIRLLRRYKLMVYDQPPFNTVVELAQHAARLPR
ncbi:hypothetical protein D9757_011291 [Collybiopsis confluens]|uniref:Uncharacterized protein n=1 Tax=Collybiopsis confluens TaxID=2823264 RepID=A0A8H5LSX5_9AGAR|nr:hypothetical protein D9757_011291 [Collybiopsis confluens]